MRTIFCLFLLFFFLFIPYVVADPDVNDSILATVQKVFPSAYTVSSSEEKNEWMTVYDQGEKVLGFVVLTIPADDSVYGYGGPFILLLCIDRDGIVIRVVVIRHSETPLHFDKVYASGLLRRWNGVPCQDVATTSVGCCYRSNHVV